MTFAETARLSAVLNLDDRFSPGLANATRSLGSFESGLGRVGRGTAQLGAGFARLTTIGVTAAIGGLTAATVAAISFEDAFAGIEKTVDEADLQAVGMSFESLSADIRAMAREMPIAAADLARIGEAAGALGVRAEDIDNFIDVVARLSVTTDLTADAAATALGQLGTILHLSGEDFEDFADSLVALGNAGASTESQIIEIANRFAAAGSSAGLSKEEILALASAAASMGIEVEAAGTALSATFNQIAIGIGTGSDEIDAFTETLGISADEFKRRFSEDALGTFTAFLAELSKLDQFEQARVLTEAGITGIRQLNAVKLMTQNLGFFSEQLEVATNATGALGIESEKRFATTASQLKILKNNLVDVGITIGSELLPVITDLTKDFVAFLNQPGTQRGLKDFAEDLASGIRDIVREVRGMDFDPFVKGLQFMADIGAKVVDIFRSLPPELQALAITGLALNKLSGGLLGAGVGNIAGGLIQIIFQRGASPANPLWVASVGGVGGVGGGAPAAGGGNLLTSLLGLITAAGAGAVIGTAIGREAIAPIVQPTVRFEESQFTRLLQGGDILAQQRGLEGIEAGIADLNALGIAKFAFLPELQLLETQRDQLQEVIDQGRASSTEGRAQSGAEQAAARANLQAVLGLTGATHAGTAATTTRLSVLEGLERGILAKPSTFTATFTANTNISVSAAQVQTQINTYTQLREG